MKDIIQHTVLSNGLTMYLRRTDLTPNLVYLVLSVKVGSFDDGAKKALPISLNIVIWGLKNIVNPCPSCTTGQGLTLTIIRQTIFLLAERGKLALFFH